ncbi:hypothetical protein HPP92_019958 [Vanilla planifolia]|uniref:Uncharacterized protein n=1 Tax=Vanilla planifolia TaxID=51239 RepID=A0A835Q6B8_VANPL|nr:hypothetical protein HPP92_019958 [Vanilla planifolia]
MEAYRHQLHTYQTSHGPRPLLEEFIPLKNMSIEESEKPAPMEKANWMVSAQLWSSPTAADATERSVPQLKESAENCFALISKPRCGGAFHPFSKDKNKDSTVPPPPPPSSPRRHPFFLPFYWGSSPELALASVDGGMEEQIESRGSERWTGCKVSGGDQPQSVATPKQIRELMKVDGLTNDEVKSHLRSTDCTPEGRCRRPRGGGWAAAGGSGRHLGPPRNTPRRQRLPRGPQCTVRITPRRTSALRRRCRRTITDPLHLLRRLFEAPRPPSASVPAAAAARYKGRQGSSESDPRERSESFEEEQGREPGTEGGGGGLEEEVEEMEAEKGLVWSSQRTAPFCSSSEKFLM